MEQFKPFENDEQSFSVGAGDGVTVQNGADLISIYGEAQFKPDAAGKQRAGDLLAVLSAIAEKLALPTSTNKPAKALWAKSHAGAVSVGGDVDLERGKTSADALAPAIAALATLAGPRPKPKA